MTVSPALTSELQLTLLLPTGQSVPVTTHLFWSPQRPLDVEATFFAGGNAPVWILSRELLQEGLDFEYAGGGDVQIRPEPLDPDYVRLVLDSPSGHACFRLPAVDLAVFLDSTYELVPAGAPLDPLDLELELLALLGA